MDDYNQNNINEISGNSDESYSHNNSSLSPIMTTLTITIIKKPRDIIHPNIAFWAEKYREIMDIVIISIYPNRKINPRRKKRGNKVLPLYSKALLFGILAGVTFVGVQFLYYKINPDAFKTMKAIFLGQ